MNTPFRLVTAPLVGRILTSHHWSGPRSQQRSILAHCREVLSGPQKIHTFQSLEMGWHGQLLLCIKWVEFLQGTVSIKQMKVMKVWTSMPWESRRERKTSSNSVALSSHFCRLSNFQGCHGLASKPPRWEASSAASTKSEVPETTWESAIIGTLYEALGLKHLVNHPKWPLAIGGWIISGKRKLFLVYIYIYRGGKQELFKGQLLEMSTCVTVLGGFKKANELPANTGWIAAGQSHSVLWIQWIFGQWPRPWWSVFGSWSAEISMGLETF